VLQFPLPVEEQRAAAAGAAGKITSSRKATTIMDNTNLPAGFLLINDMAFLLITIAAQEWMINKPAKSLSDIYITGNPCRINFANFFTLEG
jgi:hypothetical protein